MAESKRTGTDFAKTSSRLSFLEVGVTYRLSHTRGAEHFSVEDSMRAIAREKLGYYPLRPGKLNESGHC